MTRREKIEIGERYHVYNRGVEKREVFMEDSDYERFIESMLLFNKKACTTVRWERELEELKELNRSPKPVFTGFGDLSDPLGDLSSPLVVVQAFCLMPNHFHLSLSACVDDGISLYLRKLITGYVNYFNIKYDRVGSLFQGAYKITPMQSDAHHDYIIPYIHLNALDFRFPEWREGRVKDVELAMKEVSEYPWSDYKRHKSPEYDDMLKRIISANVEGS